MKYLHLVFLVSISYVLADKCEQGGDIFASGITDDDRKAILEAHNNYRRQIQQGKVPNQPKGYDLLKMSYDKDLEEKAQEVSKKCEVQLTNVTDSRFTVVGQTKHLLRSSKMQDSQTDWASILKKWFDQNADFVYPGTKFENPKTFGYSQIIWAETYMVACDFIHFFDQNEDKVPFTKMYTCLYGPGGNLRGYLPYRNQTLDCDGNLCTALREDL